MSNNLVDDIKIVDGVFEQSEMKWIHDWCIKSPMFIGQMSDDSFTQKHTRFSSHFELEDNFIIRKIDEFILKPSNREYEFDKAYINIYDFSTPTVIHNDYTFPNGRMTLLFFPTRFWNPNWGGEILFYDKDYEVIKAVSYKPNRFVFFEASIAHAVKQPSILSEYARYSIAYKFKIKS